MAPILLGSIGGCGGKFISEFIRHTHGMLTDASELSRPTWAWQSALLCTSLYYALVHVLKVRRRQPTELCCVS